MEQFYFKEDIPFNPPNSKIYTGPDSLPPGSFIDNSFSHYRDPLDAFIIHTAQSLGISHESDTLSLFSKNYNSLIKGAVFASLISHLQQYDGEALAIAKEMYVIQPNLAWMRGGELAVFDGIAVLDRSGADGLIGRDVEKDALVDYYFQKRINTTIFWISWRDIIDAVEADLYIPAIHQLYDFRLMNLSLLPKDIAWQKDHLTAYRIPK